MRKTTLYCLSFSVALVSSGAVYASEPLNRTTISWITYQNTAMAFELQRPPDWKMNEHGETVTFLYRIPSKGGNVFARVELVGTDYLMSVFSSDQGLNEFFQPGYRKSSRQLDGVPATLVEGTFRTIPKGHLLEVLAKKNGKNYELTFSVPDKALWKEYGPIFDTILASFKFSH